MTRRTRLQVIGAAVAIVLLLWSLLWRDDPAMTDGQRAIGWIMALALAGYIVLVWRGRR